MRKKSCLRKTGLVLMLSALDIDSNW